MRWPSKHAARTAPSLGQIAQRSASVRLGARAQPMSARQNAKPSEQTARDLKFQNLRAFRCRDLPLCGSRFCRRKCCDGTLKLYAASRAFRAFTEASGAFYHVTFKARFLARLRRAAQPRTHFASNGRVSSFSSETACALNYARRAFAAFAQDLCFKPTRV